MENRRSQLRLLQQCFEQVWVEVKGDYTPSVHADIRRRLAQLMVDLADFVPVASRAGIVDELCRGRDAQWDPRPSH